MNRAQFIDRVRARVTSSAPPVDIPKDWAVAIADPVGRFEEEVTAAGGVFHSCRRNEAADVVASVLDGRGRLQVLVTKEQAVPSALPAIVQSGGGRAIAWPDGGRGTAESADVGITGALWGVAETGSVVVSSTPPGGRLVSLLPPVHIALLPAHGLLDTTATLFKRVALMPSLPSALVIVTGPSKSSDIGKELAVGVHGPKELHVVLVE